jgi:hypothetical protein
LHTTRASEPHTTDQVPEQPLSKATVALNHRQQVHVQEGL